MLFKDNIINFTSLLFSVHSKKNNNSKDSYVNFPVTYFFLFTRHKQHMGGRHVCMAAEVH
jgi:hypothetical protein